MSKNIIVGCHSTQLSPNEVSLFKELQPWGLILFARNIENPNQVMALLEQFRVAVGRNQAMVFIDQEGGRVSRLPKTHWRIPPSPTVFAKLFQKNAELAKQACLTNAILTGLELKALGINANCAPMLDIPQINANAIISERALGLLPQQVVELGQQISEGLKQAGVAPVIKHLPGHGRATSDSHLELPTVDCALNDLNEFDFMPFRALNNEAMAMSAHIVYQQLDNKLPATLSENIIQKVIREMIGFTGLLMTDDINMNALSGSVVSRAQNALAAGCDIVLHCSGDLKEMESLLDAAYDLSGEALRRAKVAENVAFKAPSNLSITETNEKLDELLAKQL